MQQNKWIATPITIGVRTRYLVHKEGKDESRGIWDTKKEAANLAFRLNAEEWAKEVFEDDYPDEF